MYVKQILEVTTDVSPSAKRASIRLVLDLKKPTVDVVELLRETVADLERQERRQSVKPPLRSVDESNPR